MLGVRSTNLDRLIPQINKQVVDFNVEPLSQCEMVPELRPVSFVFHPPQQGTLEHPRTVLCDELLGLFKELEIWDQECDRVLTGLRRKNSGPTVSEAISPIKIWFLRNEHDGYPIDEIHLAGLGGLR